MLKNNKGLVIYAIVIFIILIIIMFIAPDSLFVKKYENNLKTNEVVEKQEFVDYEMQKENLMKKKYEYEYLLLDSMGTETYKFKCSGKSNDTIESGSCDYPTTFSYTESTKKEAFSQIDINNLDPAHIFNLLKDVEPEETKYQSRREYKYLTKISDLDTEIIIYTDLNDINKIEISNSYMTYIIKYSKVNIDN